MARKQPLVLRGLNILMKPGRSRRRGWITWLLLGLFTAFLCIVGTPVLAKAPTNNLALESIGKSPEVVETSQEPNNPKLNDLVEQGKAFYEAAQFAEAVKVLQQALQAYKAQGDTLKQAIALSNLSLAYQQLGLWSQANEAIANSLNLLQTGQNQSDSGERLQILAQTLNIQGRLQLASGETEKALATWQQAATTYAQLGDEAGETRSRINQAQALQALGLDRRALTVLTQVKQTLDSQTDSLTKAFGLRSLGDVLQLVGDLEQSRQVQEQSLEIARRLQSPQDISAALFSLGNSARAQQQVEAAFDYYQQAVTESTSPTKKIQAQLNQLSLLTETGKWSQAQALLPQIQPQLDRLPPSRTAVYARINFAQSLTRIKQDSERKPPRPGMGNSPAWSEIAQILATAVGQSNSLGDQRSQAYALGSLGGLYEQTKQWSEAQQLTQQALVLAQAINASDIVYRWQWQLGRLLKTQGDEKEAIAAYDSAVNTLKSLRSDLVAVNPDVQFSFRDSVEPVYREFVGLLLQTDSLQLNQDRLEKARKVIESLQLAELDNFFRADCLNAIPVQIDQVDQKAAVIYPIILPDRLEVILSLPQQPLRHYATSLSPNQVERTVFQLLQLLTQRRSEGFLPLSQQVYDWLIRPAEADLAQSEVKTLVFVLDGPLRNIPMAALHNGTQYLVEKYGIALTPGLELLDPKPLAQRQLKVLTAGLSEARQGFSAIPNVEVEVKEIQSEVPGELLLNQEFTKTNIQNAINAVPFPVVHLATHGKFSSKADSTFILTWDSRINVNELREFLQTTDRSRSTPIELLVLSACQTAKGDNRAALGIAGVAVRAGARSTLATLWSVNDEATADLMVQFYQELANTTVTKAEALRRAQVAILQNPKYNQHPYFWSPYVLVGNWL